MAQKKKKRRLKRWVRVVLWCITLTLVSWLIYWPVSTLMEYWENHSLSAHDVHSANRNAEASPDPTMEQRLRAFMQAPVRLDTADIALTVYDLSADTAVVAWHESELMPPASCIKLLTAIAALKRLGPEHKYQTRISTRGRIKGGTLHGDVIIQTDDDPVIDDLSPLISALSSKGISQIEGKVVLNLARTDTLRPHHTASVWDIPYNKLPVLLKGQRRIRSEVSTLLARQGIKYHNIRVEPGPRIYVGITPLKTITTPIEQVISPMLIHSSNIKADALYHHTNHYRDRYEPFRGKGQSQTELFLSQDLRYDTTPFTLNDGSGLSPDNRVDANFLLALLRYAWSDESMRDILLNHALATPSHPTRRGSLLTRMSGPEFKGRIFCKTGTLTSRAVSSLSGYAKARNGHWYAFVIINRNSPVGESRLYQDRLCKELVR